MKNGFNFITILCISLILILLLHDTTVLIAENRAIQRDNAKLHQQIALAQKDAALARQTIEGYIRPVTVYVMPFAGKIHSCPPPQ